MADELFVLNEGVSHTNFATTPSAYNTNTSINPRLVTKNQSSSDIDNDNTHVSYINCYEIHDVRVTNMAANMALGNVLNRYHPSGAGSPLVEEYGVNLIENPGHRITVDVSLTTSQLAAHDYFVVINADNPKTHHVAKITDISTYEGTKINIDFTPALKENVAYGVKISIYQGPDIEGSGKNVDTVVAVGYGLLQEVASDGSVTEDRNGNYVEVSSPTFYFYRNLEPDRKYVAFKRTIAQAGVGTTGVSQKDSVFKTAPVTSNFIIDKSFYSQNATLVDNNKIGDEAATPVNYAQYDGTTGNYTLDVTGWSTSAKNYDFAMGSSTTTYPTYIRPVTSPVKNQYMGHMMNVNLNRSITNKGNMAEVKFIDAERMLERKINDYENFNVKELLGREKFGYRPRAVLPGTYNGSGSTITVTGLEEGVDLKDLLGSSANFELIYIGDYYYKLSAISSVSGGTQTLTVSDRRLFSDFKFEGSSTVATMTDAIAYRNIWSSKVNNLIVTHDIDTIIDSGTLKRNGITLENSESDINDVEYLIVSEGLNLKIKRGDKLAGYVELEDNKDSNYLTNHSLLDSINGELVINKRVFKGKAEYIETDTEGGIFSLTISGRDEISTLLDYPINKNFLYSKEWVASTISPVTDTFTDTGLEVSTTPSNALDTDTVAIGSGTLTTSLTFGDVLYVSYDSKYTPIGVVSKDVANNTSPTTISLMNDCLIDLYSYFNGNDAIDSTTLYVGKNKLLAGKSLHNHYRTTPHVSLYGAADKGMVFYGTGNTINKTGSSASDGVSILSLNNPDDNNKNYGMDINGVAALEGSSDSPKDSPYGLDFDYRLIGSLSNLHLIGTPINTEDNKIDIEIGNVSPIVLARMDLNDVGDTFFTNSIGLYFLNKQGIDRGGFIHLLDHNNDSKNRGSTWRRLCVDDRKTVTTSSPTVTNYAFRFGSPIFRFNNFSDTKLKGIRSTVDNRSNTNKISSGRVFNTYYFDKPSQFSAYATALRAMGNEAVSKTRYKDYTNSYQKENPVERTWRYPTSGSLHQDITMYDAQHHNKAYNFSNRIVDLTNSLTNIKQDKMVFELDDPMCNPLFLFAPGDMLPESQGRPDHIFFNGSDSVTRNTSDYFLLVKYKDSYSKTEVTHDDYVGNTKFTNLSDNNYDLLPINNNITAPRRFNLLRLKPVTYDSYWNEVDFETILDNNNYGTPEETDVSVPAGRGKPVAQTVPTIGYSVYRVATDGATGDNTFIDVTTTVPLLQTFDNSSDTTVDGGNTNGTNVGQVNKYLFTDPASDSTGYSRYIGTVDSTHAANTGTKIYFSHQPSPKIIGYTGEILTVEQDGTNFNSAANILKNNNEFIYPIIVDSTKPNNHNIHSINGLNFSASVEIVSGSDQVGFTPEDAPKIIGTMDVDCDDVPTNFMTSSGTVGSSKFTVLSESASEIVFDTNANADTGSGVTGTKQATVDYSSDDIMFNYRQQYLYRSVGQYKHKGNIKFVSHNANGNTDGADLITIEFEALSGVTIDLTNHFRDGDTIVVTGSGTSSNNTTYTVIDDDNSSNSIRVAPTDTNLTVAETSSYESTVEIVTKTRIKINTSCHPNRFLHNASRPAKDLYVERDTYTNISTPGASGNYRVATNTAGVFQQLEAIIISGKGSKKENIEGDRNMRESRRTLINSDNFVNIGRHPLETGYSGIRIDNSGGYSAGHTGAMDVDNGDPTNYFSVGDTIYDGGFELGTVTAVDSTSITVGGGTKKNINDNADLEYKVSKSSRHHRGYYDLLRFDLDETFGGTVTTNDKEDFMFLFRPEIKIGSKAFKTELYQGVLSKYTDEGFIRMEVDVDLDHKDSNWRSNRPKWIDLVPNLSGKVLVNKLGTVMHNILNHTISKNETGILSSGAKTVHYLHIDNYSGWDLTTGDEATKYNLYEFASTVTAEDKLIYPLYTLSQTNLINPHTNKFFKSDIHHINWTGWLYDDTDQLTITGDSHNGALQGMYVVAELDATGSPSLVHRNDTFLFHTSNTNPQFKREEPVTIYMTDGEESLKTTMNPRYYKPFRETSEKVVLEFTEMKKFKGSPSIGDVFSLSVTGKINNNVEYVKIVTPFNIAPEVEQAVDQIMSENNISYTVSNNTNKYYAGNNFTGQNSYTASNILLENKNLKIDVNGDTIKVVSNEEEKDFRAIEISEDNTDIQVVQVKKDKSLLDNYNEVIVYGDGHKGIARNYSDIKKNNNIRTKEIFDYSIITQKEVDQKAIKTLKLFSNAQNAIEITIADDLPFLEPGNIITVYYPSEGIVRDNYTVIEIEKSLGMPTKLLLGQYNKDLSNTLSGILSITTDLQGNTKRKTYASVYVPNVSVQTTKFKFIQAKVTSNTGTPAIGFTYTIGFDAGIEP